MPKAKKKAAKAKTTRKPTKKYDNLDFAHIMLYIMIAFLLVTYYVLSVYYWKNKGPVYYAQTFVKTYIINQNKDIVLATPKHGDTISPDQMIIGEAKGSWFFEGSFPVELYDKNNNLLAQSYVSAQDDWMTEDFVPFAGILSFDVPDADSGYLMLKKDNPSGLPENDDDYTIPVKFYSMSEELYCQMDSDCTYQETACNNCGCPKAINKNYREYIDCHNVPDMPYCDFVCAPTVPKCIKNTCQLVEINPLYLSDPLYCQTDDDCRVQASCCPCPRTPTNKYHEIQLECPEDTVCTMEYCGESFETYCQDNKCQIENLFYTTN